MELDITLAAIVRDELINPAGGIQSFLDTTLPHVRAAVIVDTGSVDGTRDLLEDATRTYKHLTVLDRPFRDFSDSRNYGLDRVASRYALVLDADERLSPHDLATLDEDLKRYPQATGLSLTIRTEPRTFFEHDARSVYGTFPVRVFESKRWRFKRKAFEEPWPRRLSGIRVTGNSPFFKIRGVEKSDATVTHYLCSPEQRAQKFAWYKSLREHGPAALAQRPVFEYKVRTKELTREELQRLYQSRPS